MVKLTVDCEWTCLSCHSVNRGFGACGKIIGMMRFVSCKTCKQEFQAKEPEV